MKCAGEKYYFSDCRHTGKDKAIVLLSEYKKKKNVDKKKENFKTLSNNGATADKRDGQTAYLTAENLSVKVTVLADTGSDYSAIPRSAVEDARKRGFPLLCAAKDETSVEFMRPLLNSWAECSVVISCGKVDYDKSG
jgi:hypothetical protein